jgi:hypothetical protein
MSLGFSKNTSNNKQRQYVFRSPGQDLRSQPRTIAVELPPIDPLNGLHAPDIHTSARAGHRAHKLDAPRGIGSFCVYDKNQFDYTETRFIAAERFPTAGDQPAIQAGLARPPHLPLC